VLVVEVSPVTVDTVELVKRLVEVVTVETIVEVKVSENTPPNGANSSTVDNVLVGRLANPGLDPTMKPSVGEIM
jgi:hypothetical protein